MVVNDLFVVEDYAFSIFGRLLSESNAIVFAAIRACLIGDVVFMMTLRTSVA
jgi:hypothetical protein